MGEPAAAFSFRAKARFADNLYRARERTGLLQKDAAARAALTRARLDKIEGGEAIPSFDVLRAPDQRRKLRGDGHPAPAQMQNGSASVPMHVLIQPGRVYAPPHDLGCQDKKPKLLEAREGFLGQIAASPQGRLASRRCGISEHIAADRYLGKLDGGAFPIMVPDYTSHLVTGCGERVAQLFAVDSCVVDGSIPIVAEDPLDFCLPAARSGETLAQPIRRLPTACILHELCDLRVVPNLGYDPPRLHYPGTELPM